MDELSRATIELSRPSEREGGRERDGKREGREDEELGAAARLRRYRVYRQAGRRILTSLIVLRSQLQRRRVSDDCVSDICADSSFATWTGRRREIADFDIGG